MRRRHAGAEARGHHGQPVVIDLCHPCQSFWFDQHESLRLTPGATLSLFRVIGENVPAGALARADLAKCPRCHARLRPTHDMQRATRFEYLSCPHGHGRFTTFFDFLREKNFIRPLTPEQIAELRRNIQIVNCSNCGGPIDLAHGEACSHCGSPCRCWTCSRRRRSSHSCGGRTSARHSHRPGAAAGDGACAPRGRAGVRGAGGDAMWWRDATDSGLVAAGLSALADG